MLDIQAPDEWQNFQSLFQKGMSMKSKCAPSWQDFRRTYGQTEFANEDQGKRIARQLECFNIKTFGVHTIVIVILTVSL